MPGDRECAHVKESLPEKPWQAPPRDNPVNADFNVSVRTFSFPATPARNSSLLASPCKMQKKHLFIFLFSF
jgi:hypothetical protein